MTLGEAARLLRTVRHLRASQVLWRAKRLALRPLLARSPAPPPIAPALRPDWRAPARLDRAPGERARARLREVVAGRLTLAGETRPFAGAGAERWRLGPVEEGRLWTVSLHGHAWLAELAWLAGAEGDEGAAAEDLRRASRLVRNSLSDWISRCGLEAPGARALAWNAYAVATRIRSWVDVYASTPADVRAEVWGELEVAFLQSLWSQAAYLERHLEYDLRANHLLRDALGLAWAGRFFAGPGPVRWLDVATRLAVEQVDEQVLPDGVHFERSPMYHLHAMEDVLGLTLLVQDEASAAALRAAWHRMAAAARVLRHPDGGFPLLNDAAIGGAPEPGVLLEAGVRRLGGAPVAVDPPPGLTAFDAAGLVAWHGSPWTVFFDVGPIGPDYQPGHGHADTLTLEASFAGERVFVDPGTHDYDAGPRRRYDRSTGAHNTVCVDGLDSSEVWHRFRVGRRARPVDVRVVPRDDGFEASASHTGYAHLPGRPCPTRRLEVRGPELRCVDRVTGGGRHEVEGGFLLGPNWEVEAQPGGWRLVSVAGSALRIRVDLADQLALEVVDAWYHPRFGEEVTTRRLRWRYRGPLPLEVSITVAPA